MNLVVRGLAWVNRCRDFVSNNSVVNLRKSESDAIRDYDILRERGALLRTWEHHGWFLLRYHDVKRALRDERFSSDVFSSPAIRMICERSAGRKDLPFLDSPWIQQLDPPDHTRVRRLVNRGFTNTYIKSLEPQISAIVLELLHDIDTDTPFDVIEHFAGPLPVLVVARLLGVPASDLDWFVEKSEVLVGISKLSKPDVVGLALNADAELRDYVATLVRSKREIPEDDLLSSLVMAEEGGDDFEGEELYATAVFLLVAGHETTTRLITAAIYLLLKHKDQREIALQTDRALGRALEEVLRLHPPVLVAPRRASADFEYLGHVLKKGHVVGMCISSANRDPRVFPDPEQFDVTRDGESHLSFGHGIHLCLGMSLARVEAMVALRHLFTVWPDLELITDNPNWGDDLTFRGIEKLLVKAVQNVGLTS